MRRPQRRQKQSPRPQKQVSKFSGAEIVLERMVREETGEIVREAKGVNAVNGESVANRPDSIRRPKLWVFHRRTYLRL